MTEIEEIILNLINEEKTLNEIASILWESPRQIHQKIIKLKSEGYIIGFNCYDDGNINYKENNYNERSLKINLCKDNFKALVISDMHIGNEYENLEYIYKAYEYARDKDIHIILNCGDIIDGNFSKGNQNIENIDKQIDRVLEKYPYDKHILNIICLGNHDITSLEYGRDINQALKIRPDFIPLNYGISLINIGKDQFIIKHPILTKFNLPSNKLVLKGHSHKAGVKINSNNFIINVPPLSDLCFTEQENPGMIDMTLNLENEYIHSGYFKHLSVKNKITTLNDIYLEFFFKKTSIDEKNLILK